MIGLSTQNKKTIFLISLIFLLSSFEFKDEIHRYVKQDSAKSSTSDLKWRVKDAVLLADEKLIIAHEKITGNCKV